MSPAGNSAGGSWGEPRNQIDLGIGMIAGLSDWEKMRAWYDCEFLELGPDHPIRLLSIGFVAADGRELYLINGEFPIGLLLHHEFLMREVVPHLPLSTYSADNGKGAKCVDFIEWNEEDPDFDAHVFNRKIIREKVVEFINDTPSPELWGYCSAYDHVILAQIFGTMVDMHPKLRYYTNDISQLAETIGMSNRQLPAHTGAAHRAIDDARWTKKAHEWLDGTAKAG